MTSWATFTPHQANRLSPHSTSKDRLAIALPLVSVVVPCYNSARFLAETLESALDQTYPRVEIVVIDDGSSDETAAIARSYPVHYILQTNRGISAARNAGIRRSRGKYILFLDHDDRLLPEAIETGVKLLEDHPECAMAVGEHTYIGADGSTIGHSEKRAAGRDHYRMLLQHNFIETPCSALHRRSALLSSGFFNESVQGAEDHELYLRTARQSPLIAHEATVAEYRLHGANTSRNAEGMLRVSHRVLEMEVPHLRGDQEKLRLLRKGLTFIRRHFGRRLTRELIAQPPGVRSETRRKIELLKHQYPIGFVAVMVSRFLPGGLLRRLIQV